MDHIFLERKASHERYGYGTLEVGEIVSITPKNESIARIRAAISGYGQYHNKRFRTRTKDGVLYVKRIK